jgi:Tfp pilus assembly protein PilF
MQKLGRGDGAETTFRGLIEAASRALQTSKPASPDAPFKEHQGYRTRTATAHYVAALGHIGLNERDKAKERLGQALQAAPDYAGAKALLAELN